MSLTALPYHKAISSHLREQEKGLWAWFRSDKFSSRYSETAKLELLKTTYRLPEQGHESIYAIAEIARQRLQLDKELTLTIYQAQGTASTANAALVFFEDELSLVLEGNILELLNEQELLALFGHELAHHKLFAMQQGEFFSTARLLDWCCNQPDCSAAYFETFRLYQIYTEIFADMGALLVSNNLQATVSCLVKVSTGLKEVSALSYLSQAEEILQQHKSGSAGSTHPEIFLRARVLDIVASSGFPADEQQFQQNEEQAEDDHAQAQQVDDHQLVNQQPLNQQTVNQQSENDQPLKQHPADQQPADLQQKNQQLQNIQQQIQSLVEPAIEASNLDIPGQKRLSVITGELIDVFTSEKFLRTEHRYALARQYFPSFIWCEPKANLQPLKQEILLLGDSAKKYLCYVLLDFATVDPDGEDVDLAASLLFAEHIGLFELYEAITRSELKRKKTDLAQLKRLASEMIIKANHD